MVHLKRGSGGSYLFLAIFIDFVKVKVLLNIRWSREQGGAVSFLC